jgi:hypothetical protein
MTSPLFKMVIRIMASKNSSEARKREVKKEKGEKRK